MIFREILICPYYAIRAHICHDSTPKWCRRENRQQYAGPLRCRVYAENLHPRHPAKAGTSRREDGKFYEPGQIKVGQERQNGWNFLPGSIQPFPVLSACGSGCGSSVISDAFSDKAKTPQTAVLRGFCGAAIQIRTGDLILTNTLRCVQAVLSGTVWAFFVPIWVVYNGIPPTVSTQFFRVWVRVWVKSQNSKQRHGHKDIEPPSKFAPLNKEKLFFTLKTQPKPKSPPRPCWTA